MPLAAWRARCALLLPLLMLVGCSGLAASAYEYEETVEVFLDGSAVATVTASLAALSVLRGAPFEPETLQMPDDSTLRQLAQGPGARVTALERYQQTGRPFVSIRVEIEDVQNLARLPVFGWSLYQFLERPDRFEVRQIVGPPPPSATTWDGWQGDERVSFQLHLPSPVSVHSSPRRPQRGKVLLWEQSLDARLRGAPLDLQALMPKDAIVRRTMWLFGVTVSSVIVVFVATF